MRVSGVKESEHQLCRIDGGDAGCNLLREVMPSSRVLKYGPLGFLCEGHARLPHVRAHIEGPCTYLKLYLDAPLS